MPPRLFIGSSVRSLAVARAIQEELERDAEVTVWSQGVFRPMQAALDDLVAALDRFDFGVFVFTPDDVVEIEDERASAVRDNVVFELGLFVGRHGRERSFFVVPRRREPFRLPSDLTGITPATYDADRTDQNLRAALGPACNRIRRAVRRFGAAPVTTRPLGEAEWDHSEQSRYLQQALHGVCAYFEQAMLALRQVYPDARVRLDAGLECAFTCEASIDGIRHNRCTVWISGSSFGVHGLAYAEHPAHPSAPRYAHELFALGEEDNGFFLHAASHSPQPHRRRERAALSTVAEHFWALFVAAL